MINVTNKLVAFPIRGLINYDMATVNIYLYFNGNCEEVFNFYKSIFKREFQYIGRYKDVPKIARQHFPNCSDDHIIHIALPISKETILMGADIIDLNNKQSDHQIAFHSI